MIKYTRLDGWLVEIIRNVGKLGWDLGEQVMMDEMMVCYKGTYNPIKCYIPSKHEKWGIKFGVCVNPFEKYVWTFGIYMGKSVHETCTST